MIFKDEVEIFVKAGNGGDGSASFRREKYIPKGGPDGGDGGNGGSIILRANPQIRTLSHIHNRQKFKAKRGDDGRGNQSSGKQGQSIVLEVPMGTIVYDCDSAEVLADLTKKHQEFIVVKGGRGGRGNIHFKSSVNQTPFYAEKGKPAETRNIRLELKLIAHIGLVGFPNAGKSTLISRITNARPKVANYPFTTLQPNLGVMSIDDKFTSVLIADIPGLIEGAHKGKGLGIDFLKHIERTKIILYMLDITDEPMEKFLVLRDELKGYSEELFNRQTIIALNKIDLVYEDEETEAIRAEFAEYSDNIHIISAVVGTGLKELKQIIYSKYIEAEKQEQLVDSIEDNDEDKN